MSVALLPASCLRCLIMCGAVLKPKFPAKRLPLGKRYGWSARALAKCARK